MTFVHVIFDLATFVHINNILDVIDQAPFVLSTFIHINNISAISIIKMITANTYPILTKPQTQLHFIDNLRQLSNGCLSMQHWCWKYLSISTISQLLLVRFWPSFKGRFLGPIWTYSNCQNDICSGNICPCNICPYQELLSCYWSNFELNFFGWIFVTVGICLRWSQEPTFKVCS